ncbi:MAG: carboxypeptidase regulatory-like domain-containing protein [Acidobacteriota bacterium]
MRCALQLAILSLVVIAQGLCAEDLGIVQGRVVNGATGGGIAGVSIQIKSGPADPYTATTDESGAFRFTGVKYGQYGFTASRTGYQVWSVSGQGIRVQGPDAVRFEVQMVQPTSLSGRVLDDSGQPAPHVCVQIFRGKECDVFTDAAGAFHFPNLQPGVYSLAAKPQQDERESAKRSDGLALIATNFPSVIEREFAEPIIVRPGIQLPELEIRLRASSVYKLRGKVLDATGKPVPDAKLRLLAPMPSLREDYVYGGETTIIGPARPEEVLAISAAADGSFEFSSVRPGNWLIQAELDPARDPIERDLEPSGSESIAVSSQDVDGVVVHLADPFKLEYTQDWGQAQPPIVLGSSPLNLVPQDGQSRPPIPGEPRSFDLLVPGRYRVEPSLYMPGFYVSSATLNGQEVLNQQVNLTPGAAFKVVYKPAGVVRGTVEAKTSATVLLLSASLARGEAGAIRRARFTDGSAFEITDVPPGDYFIVAFDRADAVLLGAPAMLQRVIPRATSVKVRDGETSMLQLKVSPWP